MRQKIRHMSTFVARNAELLRYLLFVSLAALFAIWLYINRMNIALTIVNDNRREDFTTSLSQGFLDFMTLTLGILIEALPFVIFGVLVSIIIQRFVSTEKILKRLPKNRIVRRSLVSFMGVAMPVCECGNIPVARTLMMRGFTPQESLIFLLAAPSINLITFIVTWEAFNFNHSVAIIRVIATLIIANITAYIVTKIFSSKDALLTKDFIATCDANIDTKPNISQSTQLFRSEMWLLTRMLVIGAMIAAATQVFIPKEVLDTIGSNIFLGVLAMLALAFIISICSTVDAFFALAYINNFNLGAIMAFLVAGPMVDIKMIALMKTTYTAKAIALIAVCIVSLTFVMGVTLSYVWG